jgi:hypothetical protein
LNVKSPTHHISKSSSMVASFRVSYFAGRFSTTIVKYLI